MAVPSAGDRITRSNQRKVNRASTSSEDTVTPDGSVRVLPGGRVVPGMREAGTHTATHQTKPLRAKRVKNNQDDALSFIKRLSGNDS